MHKLLNTCLLIVCGSSCYAALNVEFNTTQSMYTVGDNVTLTCYVKPGWLGVTLYRNHTAIYECYSPLGGCMLPDNQPVPYTAMLIHSNPTLFINNVTRDDSGVNFTCQWTSYSATVSFTVQERTILKEGRVEGLIIIVAVMLFMVLTLAVIAFYIRNKRMVVWIARRVKKDVNDMMKNDEEIVMYVSPQEQQEKENTSAPRSQDSGISVTISEDSTEVMLPMEKVSAYLAPPEQQEKACIHDIPSQDSVISVHAPASGLRLNTEDNAETLVHLSTNCPS